MRKTKNLVIFKEPICRIYDRFGISKDYYGGVCQFDLGTLYMHYIKKLYENS